MRRPLLRLRAFPLPVPALSPELSHELPELPLNIVSLPLLRNADLLIRLLAIVKFVLFLLALHFVPGPVWVTLQYKLPVSFLDGMCACVFRHTEDRLRVDARRICACHLFKASHATKVASASASVLSFAIVPALSTWGHVPKLNSLERDFHVTGTTLMRLVLHR